MKKGVVTHRTTIYLEDGPKKDLMRIANKLSIECGRRIGMAEIIRQAIDQYLEKQKEIKKEKRIEKSKNNK